MVQRIQGTDGIRREVRLSNHHTVVGTTPLTVFLEKELITEEFVELYTFSYVTDLLKRNRMKEGDPIVIGWDPRDKEGTYTDAAIQGIRKAGGVAWSLGIVPTPLVPMYMIHRDAAGGVMITASHNPPDQNGIKLFVSGTGLKPLPFDDALLTKQLFQVDYNVVRSSPCLQIMEDRREDALACFKKFSLDRKNSWVERDEQLKDTILVVDPANGSFSGLAAEIFHLLGFQVHEVDGDLQAEVNKNCGVVELEGEKNITSEKVEAGGTFSNSAAVKEIFKLGREHKKEVVGGKKKVIGAIFDGDGDRFIRLDYNPFQDSIIVSSGDETAYQQAAYLMDRNPEQYDSSLFVNTVESDLNAASEAGKLGFKPTLTGVGDKWLLLEAAFCQLRAAGFSEKELTLLRNKDDLSAEELSDLICERGPNANKVMFGVGAEESGHSITPGFFDADDLPVFCGNGLKSAVNSFVSTSSLFFKGSAESYFTTLEAPFEQGIKKTLYIYHVQKEMMTKGSPFRDRLEKRMKESVCSAFGEDITITMVERPEEPDMLYISLSEGKNIRGGVYVRNSGTEDKTGVNLRGRVEDRERLLSCGEAILKFLLVEIKDKAKPYALAECSILKILESKSGEIDTTSYLAPETINKGRLFKEMEKGALIQMTGNRIKISKIGAMHIATVKEKK